VRTQDLQDDWLLNHENTIYLPTAIENDSLPLMAAKLAYARDRMPTNPILLYCRCDGGNVEEMLAICNLIQQDGNVHGHLIGTCMSAGTTIWAACAKRFIYPKTMIGIHPCQWFASDVKYDRHKLNSLYDEFRAADVRSCEIYATASNRGCDWWLEQMDARGDIKWFKPDQLIELGMGVMIG